MNNILDKEVGAEELKRREQAFENEGTEKQTLSLSAGQVNASRELLMNAADNDIALDSPDVINQELELD